MSIGILLQNSIEFFFPFFNIMHRLRPSSPRRDILDFKKDGDKNILNLIFTYAQFLVCIIASFGKAL